MYTTLLIIHLISIVTLVIMILLQQSKGAEMGASFGSGGSDTVFGASGSVSVFARITTVLAIIFFVTSLGLAILTKDQTDIGKVPDEYDLTGGATPELGVGSEPSLSDSSEGTSEFDTEVPVSNNSSENGLEQ